MLVTLITLEEILFFFDHIAAGIILAGLSLIAIVLISAYIKDGSCQVLMFIPLFRLINLSMPIIYTYQYTYFLVYAVMIIPIYFLIKSQMFSRREIGITANGIQYYLPLGVVLGLILGWIDYSLIGYLPMPGQDFHNLFMLSIIMIIFVGPIEEFIYRSAVQTVAIEHWGAPKGILVASFLFGLMYSNYRFSLEVPSVFIAALLLGILFYRTGSLPFVAMIHGIRNVTLVVILPSYPWLILPLLLSSCVLFVLAALMAKRRKGFYIISPLINMLKDKINL